MEIVAIVLFLSFPVTYTVLFPWWRSAMGRAMFFSPLFLALYLITKWDTFLLMTAISIAGHTYCLYKVWRDNPK